MLALALRNNILLEAPFALFVLARLLGRRNQRTHMLLLLP